MSFLKSRAATPSARLGPAGGLWSSAISFPPRSLRHGDSSDTKAVRCHPFHQQKAAGVARPFNRTGSCYFAISKEQRASLDRSLERAKGIEPSYAAWEAAVLPLNYARVIFEANQAFSDQS